MIDRKSFVILLVLTLSRAYAEDLGVYGKTVEIDADGRDQLKKIIRKKQESGELTKYWKEFKEKSIEAIKNPKSLGLGTSFTYRVEEHELKFIFPRPILDDKKRVVVPSGAVMEPLKFSTMKSGLIFIDGRDQRQVDYAIGIGKKEPMKIVLTAGSPYELRLRYQEEFWNGSKTIPFYFDQKKIIINSLRNWYGIKVDTVPVVLRQVGTKLSMEFGRQLK